MDSSRKKMIHVVIASVLLMASLLWMFPKLFGFQPLRVSWQYFFYEFVFYGVAGVVLFQARSLVSVAKVAFTALGFRLLLSAVFGVIISALYAMDFQVAMQLALVSYLPGVALLIFFVPVAFWPILRPLGQTRRRVREFSRHESLSDPVVDTPRAPFPGVAPRTRVTTTEAVTSRHETHLSEAMPMPLPTRLKPDTGSGAVIGDMNGFERTVRYIAEHGSVMYASVVDSEGLLLANHCRGKIDPEYLAPLAVMFFEWNRAILAKGKLGQAEKIDITLNDKRLILGRVDAWCLMVLSERQADDLVTVRINQGMEILKKFTAERYASGQQTQVEKSYV